jgi:PAS domain S-box-containing protein
MEDQDQTPSRFIEEMAELRRRIAQLEATTEQRDKREEAARENEDCFRDLFETLTLGVVYQDRNGEIIRVNPAAERILGLTLDQMQGRTSLDPRWQAIHEDGSEFPGETHPAMQALAAGREVKDVIMGVYHPATEDYVWINIHAVPQFRPGEDRPFQAYATFEDITGKKKAEKVVGEQEERIRFITENMVDMLSQVDADLVIRYLSPSHQRVLGYKPEELIGQPVSQFVHPEDRDEATRTMGQVIRAGGPSARIEYRFQKADGEYLWVETLGTILYRPEGGLAGIIYASRDIGERKKIEAERVRLTAILESTTDLVSMATPEGKLTDLNSAGMNLLGYPEGEEVSRHSIPEAHPRWAYDRVRLEGLPQAVKEGVWRGEVALRGPEGREIPVSQVIMSHNSPEGRLECFSTIMRDISEEKQLEENLKREKEKFQILVDASPLGVSLMGPDGRYKYLNPKFTAIFGYTLEDVPNGREWFRKAFLDEAYRREVIAQWLKDLQEVPRGESRPRTFKVICKDGAEKVIHFSPVSMETGDQLVIYEDITERKKLEIQLVQAQKMEAVGTLAGGIAHDFNNLLMAIQGNVSLMLMDLPSHHPDRERLQHIEACVRSGADLTKQLLGFARRGKYQVKPTDLNDLIDKASALFGRTQKGIRIQKKLAEGAWTVEVDRGQMEQVLLNLLVNAWQAMPQGGDLYLETQNVFLDEHYVQPFAVKLGNYVKTSVTDTGIGMDEETRQRIFEPFFSTKERGRGTGLGLATVYGIIKGHEGFITVYSEPDRGTTFNFYIPASAKAVEEEKKEPAILRTGQGGILLVDDEEIILQVAAQLLEKLGYTVFVAHNGREALDLYSQKAGEIDLVILDLIMPVMGGGETFQSLKKMNPRVKVLLASGYSINGLAKEILDQGCRGFIQKPFDLMEISVKIREILDQEDTG